MHHVGHSPRNKHNCHRKAPHNKQPNAVANKAKLKTNTALTNTLQPLPTRTAPKQNSHAVRLDADYRQERDGNRPEVRAGKVRGRDVVGRNVSTVRNVSTARNVSIVWNVSTARNVSTVWNVSTVRK